MKKVTSQKISTPNPCTTFCTQWVAGQASYPMRSIITVFPLGARPSKNFSTKLAPAQCCRVAASGMAGGNMRAGLDLD